MREQVMSIVVDDAGRTTTARLTGPDRGKSRALLVLGHGAGGSRSTESIARLQDALAPLAIRSLAFNFPYAEAGRRRPDPMARLERAYRGAIEHARSLKEDGERLFAGGRSMGGRVATHLAASGEALDGLVLLGYPLHPAGRPEKLRAEHLSRIGCPLLFISGTRDKLADLRFREPANRDRSTSCFSSSMRNALKIRNISGAERSARVGKLHAVGAAVG